MTGEPVRRFLRPALQFGLPLLAAVLATAAPAQQPSRPPAGSIKMPPAPAQPSSPPPSTASDKPLDTAEWLALPIDDLRRRAHGGETRAMEELARRLVAGIGVPQDSQSGASWLLRAAEAGSPGAAFNVGVMYERGFVVERDLTRAVEWYQKAVAGDVAVAKHNLALLLREGRGTPRDARRALELLQSAARQAMTASMFALGDIYERGDIAPQDLPLALAWFTVTAEFERRRGHGSEAPLAKTTRQRIETMRRGLTPAELERADKLGQMEVHAIVAALTPKPESALPLPPVSTAPSLPPVSTAPVPAPDSDEAIGWPRTANERVRAIQQVLIDLHRLRGKADGVAGAMTQAAIREFERAAGLPETGEPSRDLYLALLRALQAQRDTVARSPLPPPPPTALPPPAPEPKLEAAPPPPPPTSAEIARAPPRPEPDPDDWPTNRPEQIRAIQVLLAELKLINFPPTGELGPMTFAAIQDYQRRAGMDESGEPSRALYLRLKAQRDAAVREPRSAPAPPTSADIARAAANPTAPASKPEPAMPDPAGWPVSRADQIRAIQALMAELKLINFRPTGELGPMTLAAIQEYQRKAGLGESGEPSRGLYLRLKAERDAAAREPPTAADAGSAAASLRPPSEAQKASPEPETARVQPQPELKSDPNPWPADRTDQVRAIQALLRELKFMDRAPTGTLGPITIAAIRDYQRTVGLPQTGEPSKPLFESLKEKREQRPAGKVN
ncbi:MAG TPA: SEL1-like repeat protein [Reyranella sp.]|nr:SEL1-like repeat protein [Reyranella sp.]